MDDPFPNVKTARAPSAAQDINLNDTVDPPGGEDLSAFRDSFLAKGDGPRIAITAQDLQNLELKIQSLNEASLDAEVEELIRCGLIGQSRRGEIRNILKEFRSATSADPQSSLRKVKDILLSAVGGRVRVVAKKQGSEGKLSEAEMFHLFQAQQKKNAPAEQIQQTPTPQKETGLGAVMAESDDSKAKSVIYEALSELALEEAKENLKEKLDAEQPILEERKVINEIYLETGEVVDGNFRIINRDNKQLVKEEVVKKREARSDLPEY